MKIFLVPVEPQHMLSILAMLQQKGDDINKSVGISKHCEACGVEHSGIVLAAHPELCAISVWTEA